MAVSDRASEHDSSEGGGLDDEQYQWLQEQLAHIGNLHVTEVDEDDDEWQDPSGGILVNIFAACEEGDAEALEVNLQDLSSDVTDKAVQYSINTPGPDGDTALHLACLYGHLQCVEKLLDAGSSPNVINPEDKTTPLHDAAAGGYLNLLQLLIAKGGTDLLQQQDTDGDTALHNAARGGHPAVVQYLLQQGANVALRNAAGHTAAEEADDPEVTRLLLPATDAAGTQHVKSRRATFQQ